MGCLQSTLDTTRPITMPKRCSFCGNEVPDWGHGTCYVCRRNERDSRRYGDIVLRRTDRRQRHPPVRRSSDAPSDDWERSNGSWQNSSGVWRNSNGSVTINFRDRIYQQQISGRLTTRLLTILTHGGDDISLSIGSHVVRAWVDVDGGIVLERKTTMKFQCWLDGKLLKLCPKCLYLSQSKNSSCIACGHVWPCP